MQEEEIPVRIFDDDPNIYISVFNRGWQWYYYNPDTAALGEGAMGKVFLGYDYNTNQKVAVKQLFDKYANVRSVRDRSRLEASLAYSHPNIVEMLGSCMYEDEDGYWHVWILSNYVDGVNIDRYVRELGDNVDKVRTITSLIGNVLNALDYLHSKGVIHRDINQVTKKLPMAKSLEKKYKRLMDVIWKATDKDPDKRYQKALDFKFAMDKALEPDQIPWWYVLLGALGIGLIAGLVLLFAI